MLLAQGHAGQGDQPAAVLEAGAARRAFESLGAKLDLRRAVQLESGLKPAAAVEVRRTFMFTDMVRSTSLVEAIGDEAWAQLVTWHDQALRAQFDAHDGEEVDHAGDGFFVVFAEAAAAFECAIAIQRMLAEHRGSQGFAPSVRIGLHSDSARSVAKGYRGKGVNQAARLAALAEAHQIVCSAQTASAGSAVTVFDEREVHLKGMSRAVQVVTVDWR